MNFFKLSLVVLSLTVVAFVTLADSLDWTEFKSKFGKSYTSRLEEAKRRTIFAGNKENIDRFNALQSAEAGYTLGLNQMSDWTEQELSSGESVKVNLREAQESRSSAGSACPIHTGNPVWPVELDWRNTPGRVSSVKDQGKCHASTVFAVIGALEGQEASARKGDFVELSAQSLIDCTKGFKGNDGCRGTYAPSDLEFAVEHGIVAERSYPYTAQEGQCRQSNQSQVVFTPRGFQPVLNQEEAVRHCVAKMGPLSATFQAGPLLAHYKSGIYYDRACDTSFALELNQTMLIVGYGTDHDTGNDYWILKHSMGTEWGENGYMRFVRTKSWVGHCGINLNVYLPLV